MSIEGSFNTIVVGGGQAGLAAGFYLAQKKGSFVILDENTRTGESWRKRWDSLRLFTPSQLNNLPGMNFPKPDFYFPTKDEAGDYLENYSRQFNLPVQTGIKVRNLKRNEAGYSLLTNVGTYQASNVIVATGAFREPFTPVIAQKLPEHVRQLHSVNYLNPNSIPVQRVAVIGAGNSGAEIALELVRNGRTVWLLGRDVGTAQLKRFGRLLGGRLIKWFLSRVATIDTPIGRRMRPHMLAHGTPLVRTQRKDLLREGVDFRSRLADIQEDKLILEDGKALNTDGVVWATGYLPGYDWIDLPVFNGAGWPEHERGVATHSPGLFFVGMHFQTGFTSALLSGVGRDAKYITDHIQ
jgi:putative flavoprotein involved in K+ transport